MDDAELAVVRRAYAKQILANVGGSDPRLEAAFAAVKREDFVGPGPWPIFRWGAMYRPTPSADPVYLYTDDVVGLVPERQINNGQPSLHAYLLGSALPKPGEHIVHVGTGTGYYTAIMAEMVGPTGRVTGIEFDPDLAARARANFASQPNVTIVTGDGAAAGFDRADVIYVNAGSTQPAANWLDRLADGGRLILPLTTAEGFGTAAKPENMVRSGAVFRIARDGDAYSAKWISPVAIFPCAGNRDEAAERALAAALAKGRFQEVTRFYRRADMADERCWLKGGDWCLAYN
jgi:protein-L-isoaspartate(D-aspartate) O-methyltransferase